MDEDDDQTRLWRVGFLPRVSGFGSGLGIVYCSSGYFYLKTYANSQWFICLFVFKCRFKSPDWRCLCRVPLVAFGLLEKSNVSSNTLLEAMKHHIVAFVLFFFKGTSLSFVSSTDMPSHILSHIYCISAKFLQSELFNVFSKFLPEQSHWTKFDFFHWKQCLGETLKFWKIARAGWFGH